MLSVARLYLTLMLVVGAWARSNEWGKWTLTQDLGPNIEGKTLNFTIIFAEVFSVCLALQDAVAIIIKYFLTSNRQCQKLSSADTSKAMI
jgi:hypothetical protein